ncbi:phosphoribosylamine--glycine ligase [Pontibacillus halophilus JSM 076056 = DSM 19796]|uniref:Phosphoribosylamine--glycine ligase n=1 Tax=Pontibacillus halophilus JSM 076056 = DSM 19796 TaxID=1385510 RepID=A0A0A5GGJ2_9BACI|nr:phosphoribosylamine--glycine ligase [Pontibacillus halophilus]KGX90235.1 phosphoribosylamine--glycine ligase [Pontibacillus halophilus JSM 076056 = DSM 19796]
MNVLVIGRGGREHSLVQKFAESDDVMTVYVAPGNEGMVEGMPVPIMERDIDGLIEFVKENGIDWTFVGPEQPLMDGIVDAFEREGLKIFGPTEAAARIEGSKAYAKQLMKEAGIPSASYEAFDDYEEAVSYLQKQPLPIVIKADGLAAGKGVVIVQTFDQGKAVLEDMLLNNGFGVAGQSVVIEEFLEGEEFSLHAFVNGSAVYPLLPAQDHKRVFDGDEGPNTGGMGAYAPVPHLSVDDIQAALQGVVQPMAEKMEQEGHPFKGVLYAGLIVTRDGVKVIEFNARFGDPETQVLLPLLETDLVTVLDHVERKQPLTLAWKDATCMGVVVAAKGYPGPYEKDIEIPALFTEDTFLIHAATKRMINRYMSDGGRVLLVGSVAKSLQEARANVYRHLDSASFRDRFHYRTDIGARALKASAFE